MKQHRNKSSYVWRQTNDFIIAINFDKQVFDNSYVWRTDYIKKIIFLTVAVWGNVSQRQVVSGLGAPKNFSSLSSISSNLEAGRRQNFYIKNGKKQDAIYTLSENYTDSLQMKHMYFIPSLSAIKIVKDRAHEFKKKT